MLMVDEDGEPSGWMTALQTAVTSIVLLWSMRAGRNITAIPFAVSMDTDSEGWFSAPTLYQSSVRYDIYYHVRQKNCPLLFLQYL